MKISVTKFDTSNAITTVIDHCLTVYGWPLYGPYGRFYGYWATHLHSCQILQPWWWYILDYIHNSDWTNSIPTREVGRGVRDLGVRFIEGQVCYICVVATGNHDCKISEESGTSTLGTSFPIKSWKTPGESSSNSHCQSVCLTVPISLWTKWFQANSLTTRKMSVNIFW